MPPAQSRVLEFAGGLRKAYPAPSILRALALFTLLFFFATAFRHGWQRAETDFPNYYTAAVLVRQHEPLRNYYDWTWFARQMIYSGMERQMSAYSPQTPLTMVPMLGFTRLRVQNAKRAWLVCNLAFLGAAIWMLSRVTRFRIEEVWLLAFSGYFSLHANFLLGQYYVFLLFLLTSAFYLFHRGRSGSSGFVAGVAFALKLYAGPFLLYFVAKRKWKAVTGMVVAILGAGIVAIAMFGWPDVHYYLTQILPRSLEGGSADPYHPGNPALSTLLRRWFLPEPELNPVARWNAPWLFFFLRTFLSLAIIVFTSLGVMTNARSDRRDFAWFLIAVMLLSTNVASYTFLLLLLPLILLLHDCGWELGCYLVASYILLNLPLGPDWLFPKLWLLVALFLVLGWDFLHALPVKLVVPALALVLGVSVLDAGKHMRGYEQEPGRRFQPVAAGGRSLFSSFPVLTKAGLFFQSMGEDRYVVRWIHDGAAEEISLDGDAFQPMALPDGTIAIELARHGSSQMVRFDPTTREISSLRGEFARDDRGSASSPDGNWFAHTVESEGAKHLWLRNVVSGREIRLGGGNCNSSWPAWQLDSRAVVFASDCGRALGLPSLYSAQVPELSE
jgi:Glycosyltransferase family 87